MKCVVTGAAGFIGSHLCDELLRLGHEVTGIDAFLPYYSARTKEANLSAAAAQPRFRSARLDLREADLDEVVADADAVFHLAAMPGLMWSWSRFDWYMTCNVLATQRLLEAVALTARGIRLFVYASTSSVYGRFASGDESLPTRPISPYGVTKLAGEHLCRSYAEAQGVPVVTLRYFSVYGPRQRPDMGYHRFIQAILRDEPVVVYGDGRQVRGNTYVADCVRATVAALEARPGEVYNVGGGESVAVWDVLRRLEALAGHPPRVIREGARPGDQLYTFADTSKIRAHLGWEPQLSLEEGLARQWAWQTQQPAGS
jgi:nucleoside-diphosphate-sugar epimerase